MKIKDYSDLSLTNYKIEIDFAGGGMGENKILFKWFLMFIQPFECERAYKCLIGNQNNRRC